MQTNKGKNEQRRLCSVKRWSPISGHSCFLSLVMDAGLLLLLHRLLLHDQTTKQLHCKLYCATLLRARSRSDCSAANTFQRERQ